MHCAHLILIKWTVIFNEYEIIQKSDVVQSAQMYILKHFLLYVSTRSVHLFSVLFDRRGQLGLIDVFFHHKDAQSHCVVFSNPVKESLDDVIFVAIPVIVDHDHGLGVDVSSRQQFECARNPESAIDQHDVIPFRTVGLLDPIDLVNVHLRHERYIGILFQVRISQSFQWLLGIDTTIVSERQFHQKLNGII